jgi:hypothetical protein
MADPPSPAFQFNAPRNAKFTSHLLGRAYEDTSLSAASRRKEQERSSKQKLKERKAHLAELRERETERGELREIEQADLTLKRAKRDLERSKAKWLKGQELKEEAQRKQEDQSAALIQSAHRSRMVVVNKERGVRLEAENLAATRIQTHARGTLAGKRTQEIQVAREKQQTVRKHFYACATILLTFFFRKVLLFQSKRCNVGARPEAISGIGDAHLVMLPLQLTYAYALSVIERTRPNCAR